MKKIFNRKIVNRLLFAIILIFPTYSYTQSIYDPYTTTPSFDEEFNYASVNDQGFQQNWIVGNCLFKRNSIGIGYYHDDNVTFGNGELSLMIEDRHGWATGNANIDWVTTNPNDPNYEEFDYTSGRITSKQSYTYGRYEARIKIPSAQKAKCGFWLMGCQESYDNEIDIFEVGNGNTDKPTFSYHLWGNIDNYHCVIKGQTPQDLSAGYHTYTLLWSPESIHWLIDGVVYRTMYNYEAGFPNDQVRVNLSLPVSPNPASFLPGELPETMDIKYFKYYPLSTQYKINGWIDAWDKYWTNDHITSKNFSESDIFFSGEFDGSLGDELMVFDPIDQFDYLYKFSNAHNDHGWDMILDGSADTPANTIHFLQDDKFVVGDFNGDQRDELLVVSSSGVARMFAYYGGQEWTEIYNNGTTGNIGNWTISQSNDIYIAGDFNYDGKDDLACINPTNGYCKVISMTGTAFFLMYSNGGNNTIGGNWTISQSDQYLGGKFVDGTNDEILCINATSGLAKTIRFLGNNSWTTFTNNGGNFYLGSWALQASDVIEVIDVDGDGQEELLVNADDPASIATPPATPSSSPVLYGANCKILRYDNQNFIDFYTNDGYQIHNEYLLYDNVTNQGGIKHLIAGDYVPSDTDPRMELLTVSEYEGPCVSHPLSSPTTNQNETGYIFNVMAKFINSNEPIGQSESSSQSTKKGTLKDNDVTIYPNPSKGLVTIEYEVKDDENAEVVIFDLNGKSVVKFKLAHQVGVQSIDISNLPAGIYGLSLQSEDGIISYSKLVKL